MCFQSDGCFTSAQQRTKFERRAADISITLTAEQLETLAGYVDYSKYDGVIVNFVSMFQ